jgi:hypothetical protein
MKAEPEIRIIGAHPLNVSASLFETVLYARYGGLDDTPEEQRRAVQLTRAELDRAVLFEVFVENRDDRFSVDHFGQPGSDQAAYMERYLSPDGLKVIGQWSQYKVPDVEPLRMIFYLHFVDANLPLRTSYGDQAIPALTPMPLPLLLIAGYDPIGS